MPQSRFALRVLFVFVVMTATAEARGLYLQLFERDAYGALRLRHMLETAPSRRCASAVQATLERDGTTLLACRGTDAGVLAALAPVGGAALRVGYYDATLRPRWERTFAGPLAFIGDEIVVFGRGDGYEVVRLALGDGRITERISIAPTRGDRQKARAPHDKALDAYACDPTGPWLRPSARARTQAFVCRVLD